MMEPVGCLDIFIKPVAVFTRGGWEPCSLARDFGWAKRSSSHLPTSTLRDEEPRRSLKDERVRVSRRTILQGKVLVLSATSQSSPRRSTCRTLIFRPPRSISKRDACKCKRNPIQPKCAQRQSSVRSAWIDFSLVTITLLFN